MIHILETKVLFFFSSNTTNTIVDQVVSDHAVEVEKMREKIERILDDPCKRVRRTTACAEAPGDSFFGDNVGKFK